jgi:hypothetical protein
MLTKTEDQVFADIERRLAARFAAVPLPQVATVLGDTRVLFAHSKVRDFVPLLVERRAIRELSHMTAANPIGV